MGQEVDSVGRLYIRKIDTQPIEGYKPGDALVSESAAMRLLHYKDSFLIMKPELQRIKVELDSLYRKSADEQQQASKVYAQNYKKRDELMNRILDALSEAAHNEKLMYESLEEVEHRSREAWRLRRKRTGFLRELLYHPSSTPVGRVLIGGFVLSFSALTAVTIISLVKP